VFLLGMGVNQLCSSFFQICEFLCCLFLFSGTTLYCVIVMLFFILVELIFFCCCSCFYFIFICIFGLCFKFVVYIYILYGWLWFCNLICLGFSMCLLLRVTLLSTTDVWVPPPFGSRVACWWGRWWRESGGAKRSFIKWREMKE